MHMWMWFGYDVGEFLFPGLSVNTRWAFALTWISLFFVALMFEASKVYLARVQREAHQKLYPYRCDERRNLLNDREQGNPMEPTTSRNASSGQVSRWSSFRVRTLVNGQQTLVFVAHNVVGYLLMLAVMLYNVQLILAVVFGMMLGYFLFGTKLTRLQMQCVNAKRVICTPECDDTAENTTPPLLDSSQNSESDFFICRTRNCIQPSHYFPAMTSPETGESSNGSCSYGAKMCPSKVARAKKAQSSSCHHAESDKEDIPSVEDAQLLGGSCCKKKETKTEESCCKSKLSTALVHEDPHEDKTPTENKDQGREDSPQVTCCHNAKSPSGSQEQIIK